MKAALEKAMQGLTFDAGVVEEDGDGLKVTFTPNMSGLTDSDHIVIKVATDGTIKGMTGPSNAGSLTDVQKTIEGIMKGATVDHSNDDTDIKQVLVASNYDSKITGSMTAHFPTALSANPTPAQKHTYMDEADAFLAEYNPLIAKESFEYLSNIRSLNSKKEEYENLVISTNSNYIPLTDEIISNIKFNPADAEAIKGFIKHSASIKVFKVAGTSNAELSFMIDGAITETPQPGQPTINTFSWLHDGDNTVGITFTDWSPKAPSTAPATGTPADTSKTAN